MKIWHASDTHNRPSIVKTVADVECDVIVLTGDILANKGRVDPARGGTGRIEPHLERKYQDQWFRKVAKKWAVAFAGRPVVYCPGNHDFIDIGPWLAHYGHTNLHVISAEIPCVEVLGKRFAGFREIPWIDGEWMGETHDLQEPVDRAFACDPDVLVTHGPPAGILAGQFGYGNAALTSALTWRHHMIVAHLFGHEHSDCGVTTEMGILFSNAAATGRLIEI